MDKTDNRSEALKLAREMAERLQKVGIDNFGSFTGGTNRMKVNQIVRLNAAQFVNAMQNMRPKGEIRAVLDELDGNLRGASILGVLTEKELELYQSYYIDQIRKLLELEQPGPKV